jgi:hypothetical protein
VDEIARVVALGASNLTRGFGTFVSTTRAAWGSEIEILAAHGHGRSYGAHSRVLIRTLPGILESGLWRKLESLPKAQTRALITDVGDDILYGFSSDQILAWVEETISRLQRITSDITLTNLPICSIRQLSIPKYLAVRSILFPSSRLSHDQVIKMAEQINAGIANLSAVRGIRLLQLDPEWYGFDPIHIRHSQKQTAWQQILGVNLAAGGSAVGLIEQLKLRMAPPERRWLFGIEQFTPQSGVSLPSGGYLWLY